jgi:hypothetical protein
VVASTVAMGLLASGAEKMVLVLGVEHVALGACSGRAEAVGGSSTPADPTQRGVARLPP